MQYKNKFRAMRESVVLTQQALADRLMISQQAVSNWENGNGEKSDYAYYKTQYLIKNFYRFQCHINSGFGVEDAYKLNMAYLVPGSFAETGVMTDNGNRNGSAHNEPHYTMQVTSNSDWFWN